MSVASAVPVPVPALRTAWMNPGRDGQGLAGVVHLGGLAVDRVLQRAFQDVDDLLTRMGVPDRGESGSTSTRDWIISRPGTERS
jgi:hypothetical protein